MKSILSLSNLCIPPVFLYVSFGLILLDVSLVLGQSKSASSRPNIVILYADDMGYGDLAIQNPQTKIQTPNLDQLAREGTRFTDAHSSSGVCTPSRYALLEGRYHWRKFHGIVNSFDQPILDDEKTTLPELLKSKGYKTACIGKWHLGWDWNAIHKPNTRPNTNSEKGKNKQQSKDFSPDAFDWSKSIPVDPCLMASTTILEMMFQIFHRTLGLKTIE